MTAAMNTTARRTRPPVYVLHQRDGEIHRSAWWPGVSDDDIRHATDYLLERKRSLVPSGQRCGEKLTRAWLDITRPWVSGAGQERRGA